MIIVYIILAVILFFVLKSVVFGAKFKKRINVHLAKAEQGDAGAQFALGMIYKGKLSTSSTSELTGAVRWLQKADDQGYNGAWKELCDCYVKYGFHNYLAIKYCRDKLAKIGYSLSDYSFSSFGFEAYRVEITVCDADGKKAGKIMSQTKPLIMNTATEYTEYNYEMRHIAKIHNDMFGELCHMIWLNKAAILIESKVPRVQTPPEWLMICADVLVPNFTICDPEWIKKYPVAKEYVNSVFRIRGIL